MRFSKHGAHAPPQSTSTHASVGSTQHWMFDGAGWPTCPSRQAPHTKSTSHVARASDEHVAPSPAPAILLQFTAKSSELAATTMPNTPSTFAESKSVSMKSAVRLASFTTVARSGELVAAAEARAAASRVSVMYAIAVMTLSLPPPRGSYTPYRYV